MSSMGEKSLYERREIEQSYSVLPCSVLKQIHIVIMTETPNPDLSKNTDVFILDVLGREGLDYMGVVQKSSILFFCMMKLNNFLKW